MYPSVAKAVYDESTASVRLRGEKPKAFLIPETRQRGSLSPLDSAQPWKSWLEKSGRKETKASKMERRK